MIHRPTALNVAGVRRQPVVIFGLQLALALAFWSYAPVVEFLRRDLALTAVQLALIPLVLDGAGLSLASVAGWWTEQARAITTAKILVCGSVLGLLIVGLGQSFITVLLGLALVGTIFVAVGPLTNRLLAAAASPHRFGTAFSIKQTSVTLGVMIGTFLLPLIAIAAGWRTAFLTAAGITAFGGAIAAWKLSDGRLEANKPRAHDHQPITFRQGMSAAVRSPRMRLLFGIGFVFQGTTFVYMTFAAPFVVNRHAVGAAQAGALVAMIQAAALPVRPLFGWLSDVLPAHDRLSYLVGLTTTVGLMTISASLARPLWLHVALLVAGGALAFAWIGVYFTRLAELWPGDGLAFSTGIALVPIKLGGMLVPLAVGMTIDHFSHRVAFLIAGAGVLACALWWGWRLHALHTSDTAEAATRRTRRKVVNHSRAGGG